MSITDEIAKASFEAAAEMAKKLGMTQEEDMTNLRADQHALLVTRLGIVSGQIRAAKQEKKTVRFITYLLNDTVVAPASFSETRLCQFRFVPDGQGGWEEDPDIICSLPENAVLYVK